MGAPAYYTAYGGSPPPRSGANHASIAPYGPFRAGDGAQLYLGIQNPREWTRFCVDVLERPELADDERFRTNASRVANRLALHDAIEKAFAAASATEVIERLERARIACARMNSVVEFLDHAQLAERDRWRDIGSPAGPLRALLPPVQMTDVEPCMGDIPALGQHTDAILEELGVDRATMATWREEGTI
jgi:itaconate CoA-transferase